MDFLAIRPGGIYLDGTCGAGGHSSGICERLAGRGRLIAVDQDETALDLARERLSGAGCQVDFVHDNFSGIDRILDDLTIETIDGALLDLGVSSMQFDTLDRGFSFDSGQEADMRMDRSSGQTAAELIRRSSERELAKILRELGEEPFPGRIARVLKEAADSGELLTGANLHHIIHQALPAKIRKTARIDPATRSFMALRIAVNDELSVLEDFLEKVVDRLADDARLVIISFHSLEDRIVKNFFRDRARGCVCPREVPVCVCGKQPTLKVLTRKPVSASEQEVGANPRARSARLRAAKRVNVEPSKE